MKPTLPEILLVILLGAVALGVIGFLIFGLFVL